jgi:hypothetical protein
MAIANTTIQLKKSSVAGNVPVSLSSGELALNFFDGKLYYKNAQNTINYFAAGITKSFATVNSNSSLVLASSNNDILSFAAGNNISISTDTVGKTITIGTDAKMLYTASNTAPITPRLGDKWYYIARDLVYEWSTDGTSSFWLDNLSPTTTSNPGGSTSSGTTDLTPVFIKANAAFNKANSANILAQAAFTTANTATSNITIIQGVNVTQNTNITAVNTFAQSAYNAANAAGSSAFSQAAFNVANTATSNITIIQDVDNTQNNIISIIQGVDLTQNTDIIAVNNLTVSSFNKANSANILAQAAFNVANTAAGNITVIQGVDLTQNTNITAVNILAQAAFNAANTANTTGSGAFSQAAFNQANSANILANAAFNLANTSPTINFNSTSITSNVVIGTNFNGFSVGPLIINNGRSVTITSGQRWVII